MASRFRIRRAALGALVPIVLARAAAGAQPPVADALSVSVLDGPVVTGRASLRLRLERTPAGVVEVVASGVVVRPGRTRLTAELRADTLLGLRRYVAETRDSTGTVVDRLEIATAGTRLLLTREAPGRRMVRELPGGRGLLLRDDDALVPLLVAAARAPAALLRDSITVLDVRTGDLVRGVATVEGGRPLSIAEVPLDAVPVTLRGADGPLLGWWRDARGRLLFAPLAGQRQLRRDDPPG